MLTRWNALLNGSFRVLPDWRKLPDKRHELLVSFHERNDGRCLDPEMLTELSRQLESFAANIRFRLHSGYNNALAGLPAGYAKYRYRETGYSPIRQGKQCKILTAIEMLSRC